jgi:hypothetical protein
MFLLRHPPDHTRLLSAYRGVPATRRRTMDDRDVLAQIERLLAEEHRLEQSHVGEGRAGQESERLRDLAARLDQCWDLLRQRRARRAAGLDPEDAEVRSQTTVEGYRQ